MIPLRWRYLQTFSLYGEMVVVGGQNGGRGDTVHSFWG